MKTTRDTKIAFGLIGAFVFMLALYGVTNLYSHYTGKLETEYVLPYSETQKVFAVGFAVRDENTVVNGKNVSIFYKDDSLVYVPVISDSENIGKNGIIALGFVDESQASAYLEEMEMREKLDKIKETANKQGLNHSNVIFLNSQIASGVSNYVKALYDGDLDDFYNVAENIAANITSRQSATGEKLSYDDIIKDYTESIRNLKASYTIKKRIVSPYAGYFVGSVDGFEAAVDYKNIEKKNINVGDGTKYYELSADNTDNAYGKLIAQHTWYYIFDIKESEASVFKNGYWVNVSFDEVGVNDIDMLVYDVTGAKDGKITVTLKCTAMNEKLAKIRKDKATVTIKEYNGFKINNDAITENDNGVMGVYVIVGNIIKFAPINIQYYADSYVIAQGITMLKDENDKSQGYYHMLKQYDKIIVKGINLEDGSIVS
jgi:hypothetical protein